MERNYLNLDVGLDGNPALMTHGGQTRQEASRPMTSFLTPKHITAFGTWNVCTMYQTGKSAQVANEMRRYGLKLLGISEVRWLGSGSTTLLTGEEVLYSGREEGEEHTEGVAIMLAKDTKKTLLSWEPVSSRIITARFQSTARNITVINAYAPTNQADIDTKEAFYEQLQSVFERIPTRDIKVLLGDLNAKIGSDNSGKEHIMGTHGLGEMNDNGERFSDFCAVNNMVIGGSVFPHKRIHKATWVSRDRKTENQIDHITIAKKFRSSMIDVQVKRGADAASDHHLVICKLRLKLKAAKKLQEQSGKKYNVSSLKKKETLNSFKISLKNRYEALDCDVDLDTLWTGVKQMYTDTCDSILGKTNHQRKPWIEDDTWEKIEERRGRKQKKNNSHTDEEKATADAQYEEANREVKRSTRRDKRKYFDDLADRAEKASKEYNIREMYQTMNLLAGKKSTPDRPVKNKDGSTTKTEEEQTQRWAEHFKEVLNRPPPEERADIQPAQTDLPIRTNKPTKQEIQDALKRLKTGKAAGPDNIPPEAWKADLTTSTDVLHKLFSKIWEEERLPDDWKLGHLVKLPKKGDLSDRKNWRGITLLSIASKVFTIILLLRMKDKLDVKLRDEQAGFRPQKSCTDQTATLRMIVEQCVEWNCPLYLIFVDFEKAFDSLDRDAIWKLLRHYGVPEKIVRMIQSFYSGFQCKIIHKGKLSAPFEVETGVKQGCMLSPLIFILAIDWIMRKVTQQRNGLPWTFDGQLHDLDFADDLCLIAQTFNHAQQKTQMLQDEARKHGLKVNIGKTKSMRINNKNNTALKINDEELEDVEHFQYLGSIINRTGGTEQDVKARIKKAQYAYVTLFNVWRSKNIKPKTKLRIFNSNVKSILLYGSETWAITESIRKKLQTFVNRCLRRILRIYWPNVISNRELWERTNQQPIEIEIGRRKWSWLGHTLRKQESNITRQALRWNPAGRRRPGRPKETWRRCLEREMKSQHLSWGNIHTVAKKKVQWRSVVDATWSFEERRA